MTGISFMYSKSLDPRYNSCYQPNRISNKPFDKPNKVHLIPPKISNHHLRSISPLVSTTHVFKHRLYLSSVGKAFATSSFSGIDGSDHLQKVKKVLNTHHYIPPVNVSVGVSLAKFIAVWALWPWMLRKLHGYLIEKNPRLALGGKFENSFWGALEVSYRCYVTFMEFLKSIVTIAPSLVARQYIQPAGRGVVIFSFLLFIHQLKTSIIKQIPLGTDEDFQRENLLTMDKLFSVVLFVLGVLAIGEAFEFSLKAILICVVIGIGGVVTYDMLSWLPVFLSPPFRIGDMTKIGTVEGEVTKMESSTSQGTVNRSEAVVNRSAAIVNPSAATMIPSRAGWSAMKSKIYAYSGDKDKIFKICQETYNMMKADPNVFLDREPPRCYPSHVYSNLAVLTIRCNIKKPSNAFNPEQAIVDQAIAIVKKHGASTPRLIEDEV